ncbi:unnamed protein product, partial [Hapterophycus canaliculatus]
ESNEYYVALNRDAHAWVEYYDEQSRCWVSLESTPGRTFQTIENSFELSGESVAGGDDTSRQSISTNWLRGFVGYLASLRLTDTLS